MAVEGLVDFCLTEIALEGFEGCPITNLFDLLYQSAQTLSTGRDDFQARPELRVIYENYFWRLLVAQIESDFYLVVRHSDKTPDLRPNDAPSGHARRASSLYFFPTYLSEVSA